MSTSPIEPELMTRTLRAGTRSQASATADMQQEAQSVLLVEDEPHVLRLFRRILFQAQLGCLATESAPNALAMLAENPQVYVVVSDLRIPGMDGISLLSEIRRRYRDRQWLQFILVTGYGTLESAIGAMRLQACEYLLKPITPNALLHAVQQALDRARTLRSENPALRAGTDTRFQLQNLVRSAQQLATELSTLAASAPVSIHSTSTWSSVPAPPTGPLTPEEILRGLCHLDHCDKERFRAFGGVFVLDPAWQILVELLRAWLKRSPVCVTSLCLASGAKITTALRRIDELAAAGYIVRCVDPNDGRRIYVELSADGLARMRRILESFSCSVGLPSASAPSPAKHFSCSA